MEKWNNMKFIVDYFEGAGDIYFVPDDDFFGDDLMEDCLVYDFGDMRIKVYNYAVVFEKQEENIVKRITTSLYKAIEMAESNIKI